MDIPTYNYNVREIVFENSDIHFRDISCNQFKGF